jgi:hypothetical protein
MNPIISWSCYEDIGIGNLNKNNHIKFIPGQRWEYKIELSTNFIVEIIDDRICKIVQNFTDSDNSGVGHSMPNPTQFEISQGYWTYLKGQDAP